MADEEAVIDLADEPFDADDSLLGTYPLPPSAVPSDEIDVPSTRSLLKRPAVARVTSTRKSLGDLVYRFEEALDAARVQLDVSTVLASLAGMLSSQFLLLAGPSGTGKSTLARAL